MAIGVPRSGKTTMLEAFRRVMGEYAVTADIQTFLRNERSGTIRTDLLRLDGARLVATSEVEADQRLATALVKKLSGGDTIAARGLYVTEREFTPRFKLWVVANNAPRIDDADEGIWRRLLRLPFMNGRPEGREDPTIRRELTDPAVHGAAILAWMVEGCLAWQRDGLQVPDSVRTATGELRTELDRVQRFLDERCEIEDGAEIAGGALYQAYVDWSQQNAERPVASNQFAARLEKEGLTKTKGKKANTWHGIRLTQGQFHMLPMVQQRPTGAIFQPRTQPEPTSNDGAPGGG